MVGYIHTAENPCLATRCCQALLDVSVSTNQGGIGVWTRAKPCHNARGPLGATFEQL